MAVLPSPFGDAASCSQLPSYNHLPSLQEVQVNLASEHHYAKV